MTPTRICTWLGAGRAMALLALTAFAVGGCTTASNVPTVKRAAFTSAEYGVAVSPRVSTASNPRRGGGRYLLGRPYVVRGRTFTPRADENYMATGRASWYGADYHGRLTANGEIFSANAITGAHPTLPLPSYVRVTNLENGRSVLVRLNDRGPFLQGRLVDLSYRTAQLLGFVNAGSAQVEVRYVAPAPLNGDDTRFLAQSFNQTTQLERGRGMRVAETAPPPSQAPSIIDMVFGAPNAIAFADAAGRVDVSGAHAAINAMVAHGSGLAEWQEAADEVSRAVDIPLGVYFDPAQAYEIAVAFALLGAVEEVAAIQSSRPAVALRLTHLKPGATRADVMALVHELGLTDITSSAPI